MKTFIIGPKYPYCGGIASYTTLLAKYLSAVGHSVEIISFQSQFTKWLYPSQSDQDNGLQAIAVHAQFLLHFVWGENSLFKHRSKKQS